MDIFIDTNDTNLIKAKSVHVGNIPELNCETNNFENETNEESIENNYDLSDTDADVFYYNKIDKSVDRLFFTKVLNINRENLTNSQYSSWLNNNYKDLESAFYIICTKYLNTMNLNRNITFKEFTEFCFFSL